MTPEKQSEFVASVENLLNNVQSGEELVKMTSHIMHVTHPSQSSQQVVSEIDQPKGLIASVMSSISALSSLLDYVAASQTSDTNSKLDEESTNSQPASQTSDTDSQLAEVNSQAGNIEPERLGA